AIKSYLKCSIKGGLCQEDSLPCHPETTTFQLQKHGAAAEEIFLEPYGVRHKRIGNTAYAPFFSTSALLDLKNTWQKQPGDVYFAMPPGFRPSEGTLLGNLFCLAERRLSVGDEDVGVNFCGIKASRLQRCVELSATRSQLCGYPHEPEHEPKNASDSETHRSFFTFLPPWLFPNGSAEDGDGLVKSDDQSSEYSTTASGSSFTGDKIAVLCADPRYLLMREGLLWNFLSGDSGGDENHPQRVGDTFHFAQTALQSEVRLGGGQLQSMTAWAKEQHRRPEEVKLFFIEDFLMDSDVALNSLARFLGVSESHQVVVEMKAQVSNSTSLWHTAPQGVSQLEHMQRLSSDFEKQLAALPTSFAASWADQVSEWLQSPHPRLYAYGQQLLSHSSSAPERWWASHYAEQCRPCTFASRGLCRSADDCSFCHSTAHPAPPPRPSKNKRMRRRARRAYAGGCVSRTPSPPGLSS
ncbi:unnamed protein product, partial [Polarella glacialis]